MLSIVSLFNVEVLRAASTECHFAPSGLVLRPRGSRQGQAPLFLHSLYVGNGQVLQPLCLLFHSPHPTVYPVCIGWQMDRDCGTLVTVSFPPPPAELVDLLERIEAEPRVIVQQCMGGTLTPLQ